MKLNREELANTSFDQINFNEWRLWFFKDFVKICPVDSQTVRIRRPTDGLCKTQFESDRPNDLGIQPISDQFLTKIKFFPLSYSLIIFDNLLNEGNKSIYRYSLAYNVITT